jgi:phosphoribosylaminoimidazolecarboxamide formyltransferase/IMP cyclohydrolase
VCNLYPFEDKLAAGAPRPTLVETIDIGGPTLIRAAAKNADGGVTVLCSPSDYAEVVVALKAQGEVPLSLRRKLAAKAFRLIASYDLAIAMWAESEVATDAPSKQGDDVLPQSLPRFVRTKTLRYGENPHQAAALYLEEGAKSGVALGAQLCGKDLSYTNLLDLDGAFRAAQTDRDVFCCAIIKHTNPCGLAEASSQVTAFERALAGDPVSAFGGIIGFNRPMQGETAKALVAAKLFVECIAAPKFTPEAIEILSGKKDLRLVEVPPGDAAPPYHSHRIGGGMLVQAVDRGPLSTEGWRCVTQKQLAPGSLEELKFAMRAAATLKSNAIAITKGFALVGFGTGQTSRIDAANHAVTKAGDQTVGAFLGSDAFFPFDDCVKLAAKAGIAAIVQPGGSKRDEDSIAACNEAGIAMVFTGQRHFRH